MNAEIMWTFTDMEHVFKQQVAKGYSSLIGISTAYQKEMRRQKGARNEQRK